MERIDDWDKSASLVVGAPARRSTSSLERIILGSVTAIPLIPDSPLAGEIEITRVEYSEGVLVVSLWLAKDNVGASVEFRDVDGFRVLDEGNLLEFWPECSTPNGRLFEITSGGWLSQELNRAGSLVGPMSTPLREFFLAGLNECVSVLAFCEPVLQADAP